MSNTQQTEDYLRDQLSGNLDLLVRKNVFPNMLDTIVWENSPRGTLFNPMRTLCRSLWESVAHEIYSRKEGE